MVTKKLRKNIVRLLFLIFSTSSSVSYAGDIGNSFWFFTNGGNVSGIWSLGASLDECLFPGGQSRNYFLWSDAWVIPNTYGTISFTATAMNDISIGISATDPATASFSGDFYYNLIGSSNLYEIVIGGAGNTQTEIRKGSQTEPLKTVAKGIPADINGLGVDLPIQYKIIFYRDTENRDIIAVYFLDPTPRTAPIWKKIISYHDSSLIPAERRWFSFSSWDTIIFYSDISASDSTTLPTTPVM